MAKMVRLGLGMVLGLGTGLVLGLRVGWVLCIMQMFDNPPYARVDVSDRIRIHHVRQKFSLLRQPSAF